MTIDGWRPLSRRERDDSEPEPVLIDGVPPHLREPLRKWLSDFLEFGGHAQRVALRLRISRTGDGSLEQSLVYRTPAHELLDVVDAALYLHPDGIHLAKHGLPPRGSSTEAALLKRSAPSLVDS